MPNRVADLLSRPAATVLLLLFSIAAIAAGAVVDVDSLPAPTGYASDLAHVIQPAEKDQLEELCGEVDRQLGVQFAFLTVDNIGDRPIRDFGLDVARKWGVGSKNTNQGLLTILVIEQRQNDIEVGRGLEPYVTDGFAGGVRRAMQPLLRQSEYGAALLQAAQTLAQHIAEQKGVSFTFQGVPQRPASEHAARGLPVWSFIVAIFFVLWLLGRGGRRGGGGGGVGNFATGMLLGDLLSSGRRRGGDGWGGGGFGGDSGGGGGFGGFGGGDFGGGGASGDW